MHRPRRLFKRRNLSGWPDSMARACQFVEEILLSTTRHDTTQHALAYIVYARRCRGSIQALTIRALSRTRTGLETYLESVENLPRARDKAANTVIICPLVVVFGVGLILNQRAILTSVQDSFATTKPRIVPKPAITSTTRRKKGLTGLCALVPRCTATKRP